jgi:hypothetical protein
MYEYISHFLILLVFSVWPKQEICSDILEIIKNELIPNSDSEEGKVFYFKMKGDYHRYRGLAYNIHCFCMYQAFIFRACYCNCLDILLSSRTAIPEKSLLPRPSRPIPPPPVSPTRLG